jgi:predicted O-linked N-acetylglucosamine transferase (SPINDLY family)
MTIASTQAAPASAAKLETLLTEARRVLAAYAEQPGDAGIWREQLTTRREIAAAIAALPMAQKTGPVIDTAFGVLHEFEEAGVADQSATAEDLALAEDYRKRNWPGLLASMLLVPAWQWPSAPVLDAVQPWLWAEYTRWLFYTPKAFAACGQASAYAAHYLKRLEELAGWGTRNRGSAAVREALQAFANFSNGARLLSDAGSLRRHFELRGKILSIASGVAPQDELMPLPREGRRLRIAFIANNFGPQTGTYATLPRFEQLDPVRFEVILFAREAADSAIEGHCRKHAAAFHVLPTDLEAQVGAIRDANPDVLVFSTNLSTEFNGFAPLALRRLAPLQVASQGTPATAGLAEIDLYVSGELDEIAASPEHYVERLGLLPGTAHAFNFEADRQEPSSTWVRAALSLPEDAVVFVTLAKHTAITPEVQHSWAKLLVAVPGSRLLVHPFGLSGGLPSTVKRFCAEFDRVFAEHAVAGDRLVISTNAFPSRADLKELIRVGDIYLDTFPCSEVSSLVDALACGLPVVTQEGSQARSRSGAAVVRTLKLDELVAVNAQSYHDFAVRLAEGSAWRKELRASIEDRLARSPLIFDSLAASEAFGALVETAFDAIFANGLTGFRADREAVRAVETTDLSSAESALAYGSSNYAVSCAQGVLARDPANPHARHLLGTALLNVGRAERAVVYLLEAVQHLENDAPAWCDLAKAFRSNGQMREAAQAVQVCLGIDARHLEALLLLGEIASQTDQVTDLTEVASLAESIAPHDPRVRVLIEKVRGAVPANETPAFAAPVFDITPQASPVTPSAADMLAKGARPNPRALLFFLSPQESYRQPLFSSEEIFCGPDTETRNVAGRAKSLKVPVGSFDVRDVVRTLPASQQPELVIVKADATGRNLPRNLGHLKCPKILLVGDTHHMGQPVQSLLRYAKEEPFDFVIFDHTRHHAHFFAEAGVKNVHWLPAVDYGFVSRELIKKPSRPLTFVGQAGRHHPYRCWVLDQVKAAGLPLEVLQGTLTQTADLYADSQITLNVSLNGDLNLRVFESLAAGGFLLTDELSADSGLPQLFEAGKHLDTWRTPEELIEKIRYYRAHPAEAQRIRKAGQAELLRAHHPEVKLREFYDLIFSGKMNPVYDLGRDVRCSRAVAKAASAPLSATDSLIAAYEALQELHRVSRQVTVFCSAPDELGKLADLPRLKFAPLSDLRAVEASAETAAPKNEFVLWWENGATNDLANHLLAFTGRVAAPRASQAVIETLNACGYIAIKDGSGMFLLAQPVLALQRAFEAGQHDYVRSRLSAVLATLHGSDDCLTLACLADKLGDGAVKRAAVEQAIGLDRGNQAALVSAAASSLDDGDAGGALVMLEEAARVAPLAPEAEQLRAGICLQLGSQPQLEPYYQFIGRTPVPQAERSRRILVVTNLFPPQELGGYGRKMWEFANGLVNRGHQVRVLAGDLPTIAKPPTPDEVELDRSVSRKLQLLGTWTKGIPSRIEDPKEIETRRKNNIRLVKEALKSMQVDFMLAGNMDFLGAEILKVALDAGVPVLQCIGNTAPGYLPAEQPQSPRYWMGGCSQWITTVLKKSGYTSRTEVVYPGARVDRFFRFDLPDRRRLRICFAGLVMPYKGVHILVEALARLHQSGVDFTAEIAGDTTNPQFISNLQDFIQRSGMIDRVKFTGFLDRLQLPALFARSNVLVFPSIFEEPFGISQVEALAAGLVVLSSGTGGAREIIRDGVDGLLYSAENVQSLAEKLHALATNPELFAKLQAASQRRASTFAVEHSVLKIEQCMEELIGAI